MASKAQTANLTLGVSVWHGLGVGGGGDDNDDGGGKNEKFRRHFFFDFDDQNNKVGLKLDGSLCTFK